ncbi:MAG: metallophosphoesterase [Clostridia bacterium]|nr:metallophosphoesterase [Clostridia bacterium]
MDLLGLWIALGVVGFIILSALFVWFNNSAIKTTRYKINIEGAPSLKIVHLSDLHGKSFSKNNSKLVKKVAEQSPDFIAVTGDIIHLYTPKNKAVALQTVSAVKEVAPVIYIAGNHEMRNKGYRFFRKDLMEAGATVLDDSSVEVCGITVAGLNGASLRNDKIQKITPDVSPRILLAHEPQYFEKYASCGYDLVLCGHAHGGQWRIPFTSIGLYAPGQGKFPKYTSGLHQSGKTKMIISRGLGNSEFPLRLFNRPEIVVIDIN